MGLLNANFALGCIVGFGAMMVFGVASIFVVVFHDFHARPSQRPQQP